MKWNEFQDQNKFIEELTNKSLMIMNEAIAARGKFTALLSGGKTPSELYKVFFSRIQNWNLCQFFLTDERIGTQEDLNMKMILASLPDKMSASAFNFFQTTQDFPKSVADYQQKLKSNRSFDLAFLGLGEDGHCASIFPKHMDQIINEKNDCVLVTDCPKPPSNRMTMTYHSLNRSLNSIFVVHEKNKKNSLEMLRSGKKIPASLIRGVTETSVFVLKDSHV